VIRDSDVTLVLFDIDGTLVQTSSAGVRGLTSALYDLYGFAGALDGIPVAGRTDLAILRDVFGRIDLEWQDRHILAVREAYFDRLSGELARPLPAGTTNFGVLPGVEQVIARMEGEPSFVVGLLTGNFLRGAEIKLRHFDLWRRFRFGAFGDDHFDRRDLLPVALGRVRQAGLRPGRVIVIGDTPLDVDCAHAHGALAVAVATGNYSTTQLRAAGGDLVLETLEGLSVQQLTKAAATSA
jgi:phosphoglycolate phosphatase-like HAD superfamily hydrolase